MNKIFISDEFPQSLIVIFLGWGFPPEIFSGLHKHGFDILIVAGYDSITGEDIEREIHEAIRENNNGQAPEYNEIVVIGWSFGVKAASLFLAQTSIPVTMRLAVNGTEHHIDNARGIPEVIFNGTLSGLSERTLEKFRIRSAGSRDKLAELVKDGNTAMNANIETLRKELEWFGKLSGTTESTGRSVWDKVVVGKEDRIFPPANQLSAWEGYDIFQIDGMDHVPDFQWIIDNFVVDKQKVCDKFANAGLTYTDNAVAQRVTASKLYEKFQNVFRNSTLRAGETFRNGQLSVLELGYGDGTFTRMYAELIPNCHILNLSDIQHNPAENALREFLDNLDPDNKCVRGEYHLDAESTNFVRECLKEKSLDLIFSSSMFQWLNSPATMLRRCANALRHDGIIAISFYGPGTFKEIHETVGSGLKYPSPEWMGRIAGECRLNIELLESEEEMILFDTPADAMRHLKLTGVNALPDTPSPARARRLLNHWPVDSDGKAPLTFRPVYMILSKK